MSGRVSAKFDGRDMRVLKQLVLLTRLSLRHIRSRERALRPVAELQRERHVVAGMSASCPMTPRTRVAVGGVRYVTSRQIQIDAIPQIIHRKGYLCVADIHGVLTLTGPCYRRRKLVFARGPR
jgi:hypothetical protein